MGFNGIRPELARPSERTTDRLRPKNAAKSRPIYRGRFWTMVTSSALHLFTTWRGIGLLLPGCRAADSRKATGGCRLKTQVITDDRGNILGTLDGIDGFDARVVPLAGQNVCELELPTELEGVRDIDQLYERLKKHLVAFTRTDTSASKEKEQLLTRQKHGAIVQFTRHTIPFTTTLPPDASA